MSSKLLYELGFQRYCNKFARSGFVLYRQITHQREIFYYWNGESKDEISTLSELSELFETVTGEEL